MAKKIEKLVAARKKSHGDYTDVAQCVQETKDLWRSKPGWAKLSAVQRETLEMHAHKVGRILSGDPNVHDHWDDIAGYAHITSVRIKS